MYSHGSSARVGVGGKRGHGGREYRPPRQRRDPNAKPPPLKECACLCQLDLPEYLVMVTADPTTATATARIHAHFGGRQALQELERQLRSIFLVHLVVPGRKQAGPVAVVGQTYREALPAVAYVLQRLKRWERREQQGNTTTTCTIPGRIQRRVQDPNDVVLEGQWCLPPPPPLRTTMGFDTPSPLIKTVWIFQSSHQWSVMACFVSEDDDENSVNDLGKNEKVEPEKMALATETLQISIDNFKFRMGSVEGLEMFSHDDPFIALASGPKSQTIALYEEVEKSLQEVVEVK